MSLDQLAAVEFEVEVDQPAGAASEPGRADLAGRWQLRRAWPRGTDRLALEYQRDDGRTVAGQWFADDARTIHVAEATSGARLVPTPGGPVVLQPDGADRRLPTLAGRVAEVGAELIVHRPERRAVIRHDRPSTAHHRAGGSYVKLVRPDRLAALVAADDRARAVAAIRTPERLAVDRARGSIEWATAPGRSLHELLFDPAVTDTEVTAAAASVGHLVRGLHAAPIPAGVARHDVAAEIDTARRWLDAMALHLTVRSTAPGPATRLLHQARSVLDGRPEPLALVHRDLHDKQVLIDVLDESDDPPRPSVTVLDVDTLAAGEPAVDLANLLVHLELRVHQGVPPGRARAAADAILAAYDPPPVTASRLAGYAASTRARLAGVYAFRPAEHHAATAILTPLPEVAAVPTRPGRPARGASPR